MADVKHSTKGFTLVELMLAMAGVAVLLVSIVVTTMQLMGMYHKGLTVKSINQAGREINDMIRRDSLAASKGNLTYIEPNERSGQLGRLCVGTKVYLWNTPANLRSGTGVRYVNADGSQGDEIVFARANDVVGEYCTPDDDGRYTVDNISTGGTTNATELLKGQADLAVYEIAVMPIFERDGDRAYQVTYVLGTNREEEVNTADNSCRTKNETENNYNFCAINQFREVIIMERAS